MGRDDRLRIYLAGPEVFLRNAFEIGHKKKELCGQFGFEGVFPIDTEVNVNIRNREETGLCISSVNEQLIRSCHLMIANITPFRGPSADVGTAYEMGFGHGVGLKIFAYTNVPELFTERTVRSIATVTRDSSGVFRDANDMAIEDWGLVDNLMLQGCVQSSGGKLVIGKAPPNELFSKIDGFKKCLELAQRAVKDLNLPSKDLGFNKICNQ